MLLDLSDRYYSYLFLLLFSLVGVISYSAMFVGGIKLSLCYECMTQPKNRTLSARGVLCFLFF